MSPDEQGARRPWARGFRPSWRGLVVVVAGAGALCGMLILSVVQGEPALGFGSPENFPGVPEVNAGGYATCGVRADGVATCWGTNDAPDGTNAATPPPGTFIEANSGYGTGCGVKSDNTVACWGANDAGQASPLSGTFKHVVAGFKSSCGIRTNNTLACWGLNDQGSTDVPSGNFKQLSIGVRSGCALRDGGSGAVLCWGTAANGPTPVPTGLNLKWISLGNFTACGVQTADSTAICWGRDTGQLAEASGAFNTVSAGFNHVCGLRPDTTITCWGNNDLGQASPPSGTFKQVSAGTFHSCGLRTDNTVICWGQNTGGRRIPFFQNAPPNGTPSDGTVGSPYNYQLLTSYVSPAVTFTLAPGSGPLPPGLGLTPTGNITGTPTTAGTFPNIIVQISNGLSPVATTTFPITITSVADTSAPVCTVTLIAVDGLGRKFVQVTARDAASGITRIDVTTAVNIITPVTTSPSPWAEGTTDAVVITAYKNVQSAGAQVAYVITDRAGNQGSCT